LEAPVVPDPLDPPRLLAGALSVACPPAGLAGSALVDAGADPPRDVATGGLSLAGALPELAGGVAAPVPSGAAGPLFCAPGVRAGGKTSCMSTMEELPPWPGVLGVEDGAFGVGGTSAFPEGLAGPDAAPEDAGGGVRGPPGPLPLGLTGLSAVGAPDPFAGPLRELLEPPVAGAPGRLAFGGELGPFGVALFETEGVLLPAPGVEEPLGLTPP